MEKANLMMKNARFVTERDIYERQILLSYALRSSTNTARNQSKEAY